MQQEHKITTTQSKQNESSAVAEMGNCLVATDGHEIGMGQKMGGGLLCPFLWGSWVPI